jgi:phytoene synthase
MDDAEGLLAAHGRTFHFAARFMQAEQRRAVVTLYAFFRTLDDLVDERPPDADLAAIRDELTAWRDWFQRQHAPPARWAPLCGQLVEVMRQHAIPRHLFLDFLDGLTADLETREIRQYAELRRYCYQVAGTVGLAMAHALGTTSPLALSAAESLGIAMQLTNILRDIGSDLAGGRLYLPQDELAAFGLSRAAVEDLTRRNAGPDERFRALIRFQIMRAHAYYARGIAGIWLLPPSSRLPILIAARLYRRILVVLERRGYDALRLRAATTLRMKLEEAALALALVRLWRHGEPRSLPLVLPGPPEGELLPPLAAQSSPWAGTTPSWANLLGATAGEP